MKDMCQFCQSAPYLVRLAIGLVTMCPSPPYSRLTDLGREKRRRRLKKNPKAAMCLAKRRRKSDRGWEGEEDEENISRWMEESSEQFLGKGYLGKKG